MNLTIQALTASCWYLSHPDGAEYEPHGHGTPHFPSAAAADEYARGNAPSLDLRARRFARPCSTVLCGCGTPLAGEVWGDVHFNAGDDPHEWIDDPESVKRCPSCGPHDPADRRLTDTTH